MDDASWPAVVGSPGVCLVEFWADWCEPCVAVGRTLEEIAAEYKRREWTVFAHGMDRVAEGLA